MNAKQPKNLDLVCAVTGRALAALGTDPKQIENTLTKALGVLQEQGVYALFLFLFAREKRRGVAELARLLEMHGGASVLSELNEKVATLEGQLRDAQRARGKDKEERDALDEKKKHLKEELQAARDGFFEALGNLSDNLDTLLFARELLERALVYGRYHAKARGSAG